MTKARTKEEVIIKRLLQFDYYLTTTQIAEIASVSWNTAYRYLVEFMKRGWVNHIKRGNRDLWIAIR